MITLTNVGVDFDNHAVLRDVSLQVKPGDFVFLTGRTGTGKSTLLKLLYMDVLPTHGTVAVDDFHSASMTRKRLAQLRRSLGIVFQDYRMLEDRSVYENVAFSLEVTGIPSGEITKRVMRALGEVGLSHQRYRMPQELSGGEQQRVILARAIVNGPSYLLADEPTGNLDPATSKDIMDILVGINLRGTTVIMATHNLTIERPHASRTLRIEGGQVLEETGEASRSHA